MHCQGLATLEPRAENSQAQNHSRGCTLDGYQIFKDRESVILRAWAAPGARETIPKGGG